MDFNRKQGTLLSQGRKDGRRRRCRYFWQYIWGNNCEKKYRPICRAALVKVQCLAVEGGGMWIQNKGTQINLTKDQWPWRNSCSWHKNISDRNFNSSRKRDKPTFCFENNTENYVIATCCGRNTELHALGKLYSMLLTKPSFVMLSLFYHYD